MVTHICKYCDRGNRYCDRSCAQASRRASVQAAGRTYQQSETGAKNHAARQARYRAREGERKKSDASVFTSPDPAVTFLVLVDGEKSLVLSEAFRSGRDSCQSPINDVEVRRGYFTSGFVAFRRQEAGKPEVRCDFCGHLCAGAVREDFVRRRGP